MGIDIKIPIGLMFTLLGLLLSIFGFATSSDTELYAKSLNHNINIIAGLLMLAFGVIMLISAKVKKQK